MIHCITYPGGTEHEKMAYIIRNKVDVQPGIKERKSMKEQSTKAVAKKKFFKMVFSRAGIFVILILVQMLIFLGIPYYLKEYATFIYSVMSLMEIIVLVYIINTEGNPAFKLSWILCVMAVPVVGTIFYIYVHLQLETRFVQNRLAALRMETEPYMDQDQKITDALWEGKSANAQLSYYLSHQLGFPTYRNTEAEYFPVGEAKFTSMIKELEKAEKFIFMEYFIVEEGIMWNTILEILKRKAAEGVEVRFMYDGMCAFDLLPYSYPKKLQKYGINCKMSNKIRPFVSTIQNNRDHRKICVIDGQVGYVGGVNLADEYINEKERFGHWKDTAVLLRGDAVQSLTMIFLQMWDVDMRGVEPYGKYLTKKADTLNEKLGYVIPYADSPFDHENVGEEVYFHILNHAKKYVHIMTPYLILDNEMLTTLIRAAKSGIEVIIIMPHIPDKWYAFAVAKTYYKELIEGGVQIYEYTPGFVHAKIFVSDDDTATVGSINLDFRSLYLHFENGVFIYDNPEVQKVEEDFQNTLAKCHKVTVTEVRNRGILMKTAGQVLRLVAPLM
jgi:cardiolipin synthase A/B